MIAGLFDNLTEADKNKAIEEMIQHASPRHDFFLMMMLSVAMAAFGVILDSTIILIGSMLIAPLLYPVLSLALGIIASDEKLINRSIFTLTKSIGLALLAALFIGVIFSHGGSSELTFLNSVTAGSPSPLLYAIVAAIAGFAAAFATTKPQLNSMLPGVAISVALVPPLAVMGVGISLGSWATFTSATLLFVVNVIGILFSALIVFALLNFSSKKKVTQEVIKEEDKIIKGEAVHGDTEEGK